VYIVLRGVFRIEKYREPESYDDILEEEDEEAGDGDSQNQADGADRPGTTGSQYASQFSQKFGGLMKS